MVGIRISAAVAALAAMTAPTAAQAPSLAGKTVQMIIGFDTGGGFDIWGRAVARHIGKHLPGNPTIVPQNMPAAGGLSAANHIYNVAPKDGTVMGFIAGSAVLGPITGASGARFDPTKITWLGAPSTETSICIAYDSPNVKVKTLKDLYEKELIVGATGPGNGIYYHPKALSALLGMKFKVIAGFPGCRHVPSPWSAARSTASAICSTASPTKGPTGYRTRRSRSFPGRQCAKSRAQGCALS